MQRHIAQFLRHLDAEKNSSPHTLKAYREDLVSLADYLANDAGQSPEPASITTVELRGYVAALAEAGFAKSSIARRLASVRSFYRFGQREGWAKANPAAALRNPRKSRKLPHFLTTDEIARLLAAPPKKGKPGMRDRAMLETMYSAGLRVSELVGTNDGDLDLEQGIVHVRGKGRKERLAPIGSYAQRAISDWLAVRELSPEEDSGRRGAGVYQSLRHSAHHAERRSDARKIHRRSEPRRPHLPPHAQAQLRHAPLGPRRRHSQRAGTAGSQEPGHHANLHARVDQYPAGGVREGASTSRVSRPLDWLLVVAIVPVVSDRRTSGQCRLAQTALAASHLLTPCNA